MIWLRQNSAIVRWFFPSHEHLTRCGGCGTALNCRTCYSDDYVTSFTSPASLARHLIGKVFTADGRFDKWCSGEETP